MQNIDISSTELNIVKEILHGIGKIVVFGSRVKGTARPFSDLDLCIKENLPAIEIELLREKFENSDLPFKVDLIEYAKIDTYFQKIIDEQGVDIT